jgi:hypothetical protein
MKIGLKYLLVFCLVGFFIGACRKYEEGPLINFESRCKRFGKQWKLKYLYIAGVDSTSYMNDATDSGYRFSAINIPSKQGDYNPCGYNDLTIEIYKNNSPLNVTGNKKISDDKKSIKIFSGNTNQLKLLGIKPVGPFFTGEYLEFRVKRLTKHELWLDIDYKGNYCWIHFEH